MKKLLFVLPLFIFSCGECGDKTDLNSVKPNTEFKTETTYEKMTINSLNDTKIKQFVYNKHQYLVFETITSTNTTRTIIHNPDCNCKK